MDSGKQHCLLAVLKELSTTRANTLLLPVRAHSATKSFQASFFLFLAPKAVAAAGIFSYPLPQNPTLVCFGVPRLSEAKKRFREPGQPS